ncbi:MAG: hypothetical protein Q7S96_03995 [bacterium]|nr:hypothetical protein [bacterium]
MMTMIGLVLVGIGIVTIVVHVVRAWPRLKRLRGRKKPEVTRDHAAMNRILIDRLSRRAKTLSDAAGRKVQKQLMGAHANLERGYRKLRLLANDHAVIPEAGTEAMSCETRIVAAQEAIDAGELDRAEESYLACLKVDAKYYGAYRGLAAIYRLRKEDELAEETLRFLSKLYPNDVEAHCAFAEVLQARGKHEAALKAMEAALRIEPKNPRLLDFATGLAIVNHNRIRAVQLLGKLRAVNPDNQKIEQLEQSISEL